MDDSIWCVIHIAFFERKSDRDFFLALVIGAYCSFNTHVILAKKTKKTRMLITTKAEFIGNGNQA